MLLIFSYAFQYDLLFLSKYIIGLFIRQQMLEKHA
jgi:hypothetical protein